MNQLQYMEKRLDLMSKENMALILIVFGGIFNIIVMFENQGRMPVKVSGPEDTAWININKSEDHSSFQDFNEVNRPYLTDIIKTPIGRFSIGDIMFLGGFGLMIWTMGSKRGLRKKWLS